jgi:subtilisin-like proprotein convertase family protein
MVAALFLVMVFPSAGFPNPVHIYTGNFNLPIPANPDDTKGWMTDAVIEVPDHLVISDLNVRLTLTHGALFDLQILLQSPAGTNVALNPAGNLAFIVRGEDGRLHAYGGSVEWFFDDQAQVSIEQATIPFVGAFRPVENLSSFDEQDSFGSWRLRIYDAFYNDTGTFNHFELAITAPEPATAILLTLAAGLAILLRPHRRP